jgi:hypothetical protein
MAPPTWKNGTLIMLTVGGLSMPKGVATPVIRALSCPWVMPIAFGRPVVPLVNRTSASRPSTSTATGGVVVCSWPSRSAVAEFPQTASSQMADGQHGDPQ